MRVTHGSTQYAMIGVRTSVEISTRSGNGNASKPGMKPNSHENSRLTGKKPSQMLMACFHRGGASGITCAIGRSPGR